MTVSVPHTVKMAYAHWEFKDRLAEVKEQLREIHLNQERTGVVNERDKLDALKLVFDVINDEDLEFWFDQIR